MQTELTVQYLDAKLDAKFDHLSGKIDHLADTLQDVLETMNVFATNVDKRFEQIDKRFDQNDKAHAEMREELGVVSRKANTKLTVLVDSLVSEKSLDFKTAQRILALEPYGQR